MSKVNPSSSPQLEHISLQDGLDECLRRADELKAEGNDHFRASRWDEARIAYRSGLGHLPKRKDKRKTGLDRNVDLDGTAPGDDSIAQDRDVHEGPSTEGNELEPPETDLERQCAKVRAILNANIGACYVKLGDHKLAVDACAEALLDDPLYVKALQRRAISNERINSWSSLTSAQEDYSTLLRLLPSDSPQIREIEISLRLLKPRVEAAQKQETAEMLGKLKDLGNNVLGKFGLSTDNFKFERNEQGSYSVNFSQ